MTNRNELLLELGTEELPPGALPRLRDAFESAIVGALDQREIAHGESRAFATPRRLAVIVSGVADHQPDRFVSRRGPAVSVAFGDDGEPTQAALGFARSCGVEFEQLGRLKTAKGEWLQHQVTAAGRPLSELIQDILDEGIAALPVPRRMRWGTGDATFLRPVHWLLALHGHDVMPCSAFGIEASRVTRGHRFHCPEPIIIPEPAAYEGLLAEPGHVVAKFSQRREMIREQVSQIAAELGGTARISDALLDEVTALVEWPVALAGSIETRFLALPTEVLTVTIESHQRYFPVFDADGALMPHFITVTNLRSERPEEVRAGNERVVRPRLEDALFFWNKDTAQPLSSLTEGLTRVTYQSGLGSLADKTERLAALAAALVDATGADAATVARAAALSRADLLSDLVYEFTELQGTMGRHYALNSGEPEAVAQAIEEMYQPRQSGDPLPLTPAGQCLALADRIDALAAFFAIDQKPSGDRDPFGLRRAALATLRILIEGKIDLSLTDLFRQALEPLPESSDRATLAIELRDFCLERLKGYYAERGIGAEVFESVLAVSPDHPLDFHRRVTAVPAFLNQPEATALGAAHKRVRNILRQQSSDSPALVDASALAEPAEKTLFEALESTRDDVSRHISDTDYDAALKRLATLQKPVDAFFDDVMVMDEDLRLRNNRLALLSELDLLCRSVADLSRLPG